MVVMRTVFGPAQGLRMGGVAEVVEAITETVEVVANIVEEGEAVMVEMVEEGEAVMAEVIEKDDTIMVEVDDGKFSLRLVITVVRAAAADEAESVCARASLTGPAVDEELEAT